MGNEAMAMTTSMFTEYEFKAGLLTGLLKELIPFELVKEGFGFISFPCLVPG